MTVEGRGNLKNCTAFRTQREWNKTGKLALSICPEEPALNEVYTVTVPCQSQITGLGGTRLCQATSHPALPWPTSLAPLLGELKEGQGAGCVPPMGGVAGLG